MKGYGIEITNNLLDRKHTKKMGVAIWEFMWCLDKVTSVSEDGLGKVLGGKPIKWIEVKKNLGKSESSISDNMNRLEREGYVNLTRTPFGHVITVNKTKKRFKKASETTESDFGKGGVELRKVPNLTSENADYKEDSISRISTVRQDTAEPSSAELIPEVIKAFENVNPACKKFYSNTTQRRACADLLEEYGFEQIMRIIEFLPRSNSMAYVPTITTPVQLWEKYEALRSGLEKKKVELSGRGRGLA